MTTTRRWQRQELRDTTDDKERQTATMRFWSWKRWRGNEAEKSSQENGHCRCRLQHISNDDNETLTTTTMMRQQRRQKHPRGGKTPLPCTIHQWQKESDKDKKKPSNNNNKNTLLTQTRRQQRQKDTGNDNDNEIPLAILWQYLIKH